MEIKAESPHRSAAGQPEAILLIFLLVFLLGLMTPDRPFHALRFRVVIFAACFSLWLGDVTPAVCQTEVGDA